MASDNNSVVDLDIGGPIDENEGDIDDDSEDDSEDDSQYERMYKQTHLYPIYEENKIEVAEGDLLR